MSMRSALANVGEYSGLVGTARFVGATEGLRASPTWMPESFGHRQETGGACDLRRAAHRVGLVGGMVQREPTDQWQTTHTLSGVNGASLPGVVESDALPGGMARVSSDGVMGVVDVVSRWWTPGCRFLVARGVELAVVWVVESDALRVG
jgi:hypothetical protein